MSRICITLKYNCAQFSILIVLLLLELKIHDDGDDSPFEKVKNIDWFAQQNDLEILNRQTRYSLKVALVSICVP